MRGVAKIDKVSGKVVARYDTIAEAAEVTRTPYKTIANQAREKRVSQGRYFWRYADEVPSSGRVDIDRRRSVRLRDTKSGREFIFFSAHQAALRLDLDDKSILKSCKLGAPIKNAWQAQYN